MRLLLPVLALVLTPGLAAAECSCACIGGRSVPICAPAALVQPICQQICTPRIEQSLGQNPLAGGGGGGALGGSTLPNGIDASVLNNPATLNALQGMR